MKIFCFFFIVSIQMSMIKLQSADGECFETDVQVAKCSGTIKTMLESCDLDDEAAVIPLSKVNANILKLVLEWASHHKDDQIPMDANEKKEKRTDDIAPWDVEFLKVDQSTLFEIIEAANFLDTKGLMEAACKTVANMMKGKSPQQILETFEIEDDFTEEEREKIRKEDELCKEA